MSIGKLVNFILQTMLSSSLSHIFPQHRGSELRSRESSKLSCSSSQVLDSFHSLLSFTSRKGRHPAELPSSRSVIIFACLPTYPGSRKRTTKQQSKCVCVCVCVCAAEDMSLKRGWDRFRGAHATLGGQIRKGEDISRTGNGDGTALPYWERGKIWGISDSRE